MFKKLIFISSVILMFSFAGCGGGGTDIATGQFKDSNVKGLSYVSGEQSGITDTNGYFTYEVGNTITFSIGGVTLGTTIGKSVITPLDLVVSGTLNNTAVQNIARFLMMLDKNNDATDGIEISTAVQAAATSWSNIDFTTADLTTALANIMSSIDTEDSRTSVLPDASTASTHLESTLKCVYSGIYKGTFSGDDNGFLGVLVNALDTSIVGSGYSNLDGSFINDGLTITYAQDVTFGGTTTEGTIINGKFTSLDKTSGSWEYSTSEKGTFSAARLGSDKDTVYRYTVNDSTNYIFFSIDVDTLNKVTGIVYGLGTGEFGTISGTISGSDPTSMSLSATASDSDDKTMIITATVNSNTGTLTNGEWNYNSGEKTGTFTGCGCKLN